MALFSDILLQEMEQMEVFIWYICHGSEVCSSKLLSMFCFILQQFCFLIYNNYPFKFSWNLETFVLFRNFLKYNQ